MAENQNNGFEMLGDGLKSVFLAGIGALSLGAEKGKEVVDVLVKQGEISFEQGKEINSELQRKAADATQSMRDTALEARMKAMSPEDRDEFVAKVAEYAQKLAAEAEVPVEAETVEEAAEAAEAQPADQAE